MAGSASEKLASMLLRKERSKSLKKVKTSTYRKALRTGMRRAYMEKGETKDSLLARFGPTYRSATAVQQGERKLRQYYGRGLYSGRGSFWGDAWNAARGAWDASKGAREMLGGAARSGMFGAVGTTLGNVSQALGTGEYITNDLVNQGMGAPDGVPSFGLPSDQGVLLSNSEYVSDIFGPNVNGAFENNIFEINPGLFKTFPWLSQVAGNYEEYELKQLIFTFKPTITDFVSTNGQVGTLVMATQYNVEDTPFTNKQDMMHYAGSMATKVSQGMLHGVECDPSKNSGAPGKFIRAGAVLPAQDKANFDLGTLNLAVVNTPAEFTNKALGELWVSYTLILRKPKFYAAEGSTIVQDYNLLIAPVPNQAAQLTNNWKTYPALQNRINGNVVFVGTTLTPNPAIRYVFPASLQGTFKVIMKLFTNDVSAITANIDVGIESVQSCFPVKDLISKGPQGPIEQMAWDWKTISGARLTGTETSCITIECDVRLESPPSVGSVTDNSLVFYAFPLPGAAAITFTHAELRCVNYNNYFNYGGTGQVILLDPTTGQVNAPVTAIN